MKTPVANLQGKALDFFVGVAVDDQPPTSLLWRQVSTGAWSPSTKWEQGGALIDQFRVRLDPRESVWHAQVFSGDDEHEVRYAPTALVAAMRVIVLSRLGPEVDVPEELLA